MIPGFEEVRTDVKTINAQGEEVVLENVMALRSNETGKIWLVPSEVSKAEFKRIGMHLDLNPRQIPLMLIVYSKTGIFSEGTVFNKYKLNKMLFYQWKELEKKGLGDAFLHDEFIPEKKGPVPKFLYDDLKILSKTGILKLSGGKEEKSTLEVKLTKKGMEMGEEIWNSIPWQFRQISYDVKTRLFPLDPKTIMEQVHKDYPEYRKTYVEVDAE